MGQLKNMKQQLLRQVSRVRMNLRKSDRMEEKRREREESEKRQVKQRVLVRPYLERFRGCPAEIKEWKSYIINDMVILQFIKKYQIEDFIDKHSKKKKTPKQSKRHPTSPK